MKEYLSGLRAGIPIALGYLSVSFTFEITAVSYGMTRKPSGYGSFGSKTAGSMATVTVSPRKSFPEICRMP